MTTLTATRITERTDELIDLLLAEERPNISAIQATRTQLEDWAAGYPSQVHGAAPATTPPPPPPKPGDEPVGAVTAVEHAYFGGDNHAATLNARLTGHLARAATFAATILTIEHDTTPPAERSTDHARLALCRLALRAGSSSTDQLTAIHHELSAAAAIVENAQPATPPERLVDGCHACEQAGTHTPIDRRHRRQHLCRWCGQFRLMHGVNPPPPLIRLHDRGIKVTRTHLHANGINTP